MPVTGSAPGRRAVNELVQRLTATLGSDVIAVTLFGSTARGDAHAESDVDVLVLATRCDWEFRDGLRSGVGD